MGGVDTSAARRFQGQVVTAQVPVRPRPRSGDWAVHRASDGRVAFIAPSVLTTAFAAQRRYAPDETAGLVFGRGYRDAEGQYVVATGAQTPRAGEVIGSVSTVEITAEGAEAMTQRYHEHDFVADLIGWWHTHPSYTAYFSGTDRDEQGRWNTPVSVGIVVAGEPRGGDPYAVYIGPDAAEAPVVRRGRATPGLAAVSEAQDARREPPRITHHENGRGAPAERRTPATTAIAVGRDDVRPPDAGEAAHHRPAHQRRDTMAIRRRRLIAALAIGAVLVVAVLVVLLASSGGGSNSHPGAPGATRSVPKRGERHHVAPRQHGRRSSPSTRGS
jgi:proteasome lid subunit RPN8/RPN11